MPQYCFDDLDLLYATMKKTGSSSAWTTTRVRRTGGGGRSCAEMAEAEKREMEEVSNFYDGGAWLRL